MLSSTRTTRSTSKALPNQKKTPTVGNESSKAAPKSQTVSQRSAPGKSKKGKSTTDKSPTTKSKPESSRPRRTASKQDSQVKPKAKKKESQAKPTAKLSGIQKSEASKKSSGTDQKRKIVANTKGRWSTWNSIQLSSPYELSLENTLQSGQVFHWINNPSQDCWAGVLHKKYFQLKEKLTSSGQQKELLFRRWCASNESNQVDPVQDQADLEDFFQLKYSLKDLVKKWGKSPACGASVFASGAIEKLNPKLHGLRLLRQDPESCLLSFLCSQNNNISRIGNMIKGLMNEYGQYLFTTDDGTECFAFPTVADLSESANEDVLRNKLKFGYRAKYIVNTSAQLHAIQSDNDPSQRWKLKDLRNSKLTREQVKEKLVQFPGIGSKVADCISLFSLDRLDVIPVDTHVYSIGKKYLGSKLTGAKGTPQAEVQIHDWFKSQFSDKAGWAHTFMFVMDLASFPKPEKKPASTTTETKRASKRSKQEK